ncbi:MAG: Bax inhibitor-1 family protein [Blastocatellales bacterium]
MQAEKYVRSGSYIGEQLKTDLNSIKGLVIAVFAGLVLMFLGFRALPVESTPLLAKVMCLLSLSIASGGVGAYLGRNIRSLIAAIGLFIVSLIGMFVVRAAGDGLVAVGLLMGWSTIFGMMFGPFLAYAISEEGPGIVIQSLTGTTAVMIITGIVAMTSGINFSALGPILLIGLLGLIVVGLVGMFVRFSRTVNIVYSVIGMLIFAGLFLFKFFNLSRSENTWEAAISHAMSIYISFVNFFLYLLQFLMATRRR